MLPDHIKTKAMIKKFYNRFLDAQIKKHSGAFADVPTQKLIEGVATSFIRPTGEEDINHMNSVSTESSIGHEEIPLLTIEKALEILEALAVDIASQKVSYFYKTISETVEKTGNTLRKGSGLTAETILEAMEKIELNFDKNGQPILPEIHIHPTKQDALVAELTKIKENPDLQERWENIINRQKDAWRARESNRKLVG